MNLVRYTALNLYNKNWDKLNRIVRNFLFEWVDFSEVKDGKLVDDDTHITIMWNEEFNKTLRWTYWYMVINHRERFKALSEERSIYHPYIFIDTFDNDDNRVLKFNMEGCNIHPICEDYFKDLDSLASEPSKFSKYNPHITIAYLKPDTPDEVIDKFKQEINLKDFYTFDMKELIIKSDTHQITSKIEVI